jgi:NDP-sugar pyrophosphorylase family protein
MQAVILAGGLGTRLWPVTRATPKPMVCVAGVPYLEHQLRLLRQQDITDVVLLIGYLGEQVETYFGDGRRWGLSLRYAREETLQRTGGALRDAGPLLAGAFLLLYGDSYLPIRYADVWHALVNSPACGVAVVYDNADDTSVQNNVAVNEDGYVSRYDKHGEPGASATGGRLTHVEAGVLALRKGVLGLIPAGRPASLEEEVFPQLVAAHQLRAFVTQQRFYDVGTPERLRALERLLTP